MQSVMPHKLEALEQLKTTFANRSLKDLSAASCTNGFASSEQFPCKGIDMLGFLSFASMGSSSSRAGNDIWGWTDPETGREYALSGLERVTAIVDVTNGNMVPIATISRATSSWSDIKVFKNTMYIGTEGSFFSPAQGIQVFDLTRLRGLQGGVGNVQSLSPDYVYDELTSSHNVVLNEQTGYLYVVGSNTCSGGLHIADLNSNPLRPEYVGCYSSDGYTHDAQCVVYNGPDTKYTGREICFNYNEDSLLIVDVTDKNNIREISNTRYSGSKYTHQGWITEDQSYLLLNDELDEQNGSNKKTHTYLWDISSLENAKYFADYFSPVDSVDHNLYVKGKYGFLSNYASGLRVLDLTNIGSGNLEEVAYFDVFPEYDRAEFTGSWSAYVYFPSGNIAVNSIDRGLFLLKGSF